LAASVDDGMYVFQCSCPVSWQDPWIGSGAFSSRGSHDNLVITDEDTIVIIQEIPLDADTLEGFAESRTSQLEKSNSIEDLEVVFSEVDDTVLVGRSWTNQDGDLMYDFQVVQVWETNYIISFDVIAPAEDFADSFDSVHSITLVIDPLLQEYKGRRVERMFDA
jgi:hypothetical protein